MLKNFTPLHLILILLLLTLIGVTALILTVKMFTAEGMPSLYELENPSQNIATQIYSADGEILDHFFIEKRIPLTYNEIPKNFVNALIATEDRKFWTHWGVHTERIVKSMVKNLLAGRTKEGASTITMQLARNLYLTRETSFKRKVREAVTAFQIEQTYTKQEIIELYANTVNFGRGSYGLRIAAKQYFDKEPEDLSVAESAFLVGLLKKPEFYNRRENYDDAISRRNLVLSMMFEQGFISGTEYNRSIAEPITFMQSNIPKDKQVLQRRIGNLGIAPHFVETIRQNLKKDRRLKTYDYYSDGLTIYTTLDTRIQTAVNKAVNEFMPEVQKTFLANWSWSRNKRLLDRLIEKAITNLAEYKEADPAKKQLIKARLSKDEDFINNIKNISTTVQLGVIVIDQSTGAILAMVGASPKSMAENPDAKYSLNHAVQIKRQPGSSFKPFIYASALQKGRTPDSQIESGPYTYVAPNGEVWSPRGSGKDSAGTLTLTQALVASVNTVSARLITQTTNPGDVISLVQKAGIDSKLDAVPALSLGGGGDVSPLEITAAYSIFGNNGIFVNPHFYDRIQDKYGETISERKISSSFTDVLEKEIAGQMTYMMQQVVRYGTAARVKNYLKDVDAAGKTGTTNDAADAWFIGYTPQLVCGIWLGFDDKRINFNCLGAAGYGGRIAAPLWGAVIAEIYAIPNLPYKQKRFVTNFKDGTTKSNQPYSLTKTQIEFQQQQQFFLPRTEEEEIPIDDDIRRGTYLPDAFLFNERRRKF